jgi:hypothetical protein
MFSFDFRKTSAWDYQRRMLRPWPTSPLRSMWAAITVLLGHRSIRCGPRLRHVGHDYGETKNAAHIRTESRPTSHRNQWPTSNGITGPHRPEYAATLPREEPSNQPAGSPGWAAQEETQPGSNRSERRQSAVRLRELRGGSPTPTRRKTALSGEDCEKNRTPCSRCHLIAGFRREANIVQDDDDGLGVSCLGDNRSEWANRV